MRSTAGKSVFATVLWLSLALQFDPRASIAAKAAGQTDESSSPAVSESAEVASAADAIASESAPMVGAPPTGIVALLTDYGSVDFYVGALKGAVLKVCPTVRIIDLSHDVPAYDINTGAWQLLDSAREFPPGTVFVGIVDPGVGTARRPIILRTAAGQWFVGPDNGLFTVVERELGPGEYREITNREWMRPGWISTSFHGRDIFGPVAGRLACGAPTEGAGPVVMNPVRLVLRRATLKNRADGGIEFCGHVLFADHYGNLQTDIPGAWLDSLSIKLGTTLVFHARDREEELPYVRAYEDVPGGEPLLLVASTGRIEVALNQDSAATWYEAAAGDSVTVRVR